MTNEEVMVPVGAVAVITALGIKILTGAAAAGIVSANAATGASTATNSAAAAGTTTSAATTGTTGATTSAGATTGTATTTSSATATGATTSLSTGTKVAIGAGALLAVGGVAAVAASSGSSNNTSTDGNGGGGSTTGSNSFTGTFIRDCLNDFSWQLSCAEEITLQQNGTSITGTLVTRKEYMGGNNENVLINLERTYPLIGNVTGSNTAELTTLPGHDHYVDEFGTADYDINPSFTNRLFRLENTGRSLMAGNVEYIRQ